MISQTVAQLTQQQVALRQAVLLVRVFEHGIAAAQEFLLNLFKGMLRQVRIIAQRGGHLLQHELGGGRAQRPPGLFQDIAGHLQHRFLHRAHTGAQHLQRGGLSGQLRVTQTGQHIRGIQAGYGFHRLVIVLHADAGLCRAADGAQQQIRMLRGVHQFILQATVETQLQLKVAMLRGGHGQAIQAFHGGKRFHLRQNAHCLLPQPLIHQPAHEEPAELALRVSILNPAQAGAGVFRQLKQAGLIAGQIVQQA